MRWAGAPSEWIAYSNFMRLPRLALGSVKSKASERLGPPPPKRPNCSYQIFALGSETTTPLLVREDAVSRSKYPSGLSNLLVLPFWPEEATMH
jgi:hypothetical protein